MRINNRSMRGIAGLAMIASVIWGPWWLTWSFAIIFLFLFPSYYEIIIAGVAYDALYGLPLAQFHNFPYVFTVSSAFLFIIAFFLRKKLLVYN